MYDMMHLNNRGVVTFVPHAAIPLPCNIACSLHTQYGVQSAINTAVFAHAPCCNAPFMKTNSRCKDTFTEQVVWYPVSGD